MNRETRGALHWSSIIKAASVLSGIDYVRVIIWGRSQLLFRLPSPIALDWMMNGQSIGILCITKFIIHVAACRTTARCWTELKAELDVFYALWNLFCQCLIEWLWGQARLTASVTNCQINLLSILPDIWIHTVQIQWFNQTQMIYEIQNSASDAFNEITFTDFQVKSFCLPLNSIPSICRIILNNFNQYNGQFKHLCSLVGAVKGKLSTDLLPVLYLLVRLQGYISSTCYTVQYTIWTVMVCPKVFDFPV